MTAALIIDFKDVTPEGDIIQMRVWHVPQPVAPSEHEFKYSLFYGRGTQRIVGFDNERGKGDHCHIDGIERPYRFTDIERLIEDFIAAVAERRKT
ncbi:MAG: DUF6516 family protein [Rhodocyclaceae bacterium]|nr:DUF6516 family protein [Rhodocyclaceae bacterium]